MPNSTFDKRTDSNFSLSLKREEGSKRRLFSPNVDQMRNYKIIHLDKVIFSY